MRKVRNMRYYEDYGKKGVDREHPLECGPKLFGLGENFEKSQ